ERRLHERRDLEEADPAFEEGGDRDLVRGVERTGERAAARSRLPGEAQERKALEIGSLELERQPGLEVEPWNRRRRPLRVAEGERDRDAHVRVAEVRECSPVAKADDRVDDRRRMDDDLDALVREPEQEVCLDELEPLVGER